MIATMVGRIWTVFVAIAIAIAGPAGEVLAGPPSVGALFSNSHRHFCTGAVVSGGAGDIVVTAAHCLYGRGFRRRVFFVPRYDRGRRPYGTWTSTTMLVDRRWRLRHDADLDFGFIVLRPRYGRRIASVVGANTLITNPGFHNLIRVIGYPSRSDRAVVCDSVTHRFGRFQLRFYCPGFYGGTSGSPFLRHYSKRRRTGEIMGVIGGYQAGGAYSYLSYSAYFDHDIRRLYGQVESLDRLPRARHRQVRHRR